VAANSNSDLSKIMRTAARRAVVRARPWAHRVLGTATLMDEMADLNREFDELSIQLSGRRDEARDVAVSASDAAYEVLALVRTELVETQQKLAGASSVVEAASAVRSIEDRLSRLESVIDVVRSDMSTLDRLTSRRLAASSRPGSKNLAPETVDPEMVALGAFFERFANRFRGSEDLITERLAQYLQAVKEQGTVVGPAVDIGGGRGEWVRLLGDMGRDAYAVSIKGLPNLIGSSEADVMVRDVDAFEHLSSLPEQSVSVVSAFHVLEHLPFADVVNLLDLAFRSLQPGGLLIIETPNPLNVIVGASSFWVDPMHRRPIHPTLLSFAVEDRGFTDVELRFLQPLAETIDFPEHELASLHPLLRTVMLGAQDYGVVARRQG